MNKEVKLKQDEISKINRKLFFIGIILIIGFFLVEIASMAVVGTRTQEIDSIRRQKQELRLQNSLITSQIDASKSISSTIEVKDKYELVQKTVTFLDNPSSDEVALK